jgi:hypothetical protein
MSPLTRILIFFILPLIAVLSFSPKTLAAALPLVGVAALVFVALGYLLWRGRTLALTLMIFIQGLNIIVRLMMFFSNAKPAANAPWDVTYIIASFVGLIISTYLMFRLDRGDVRSLMVT